jgi:hypothetical protein
MTVEQLIEQCRKARHDYRVQDKKMRERVWLGGRYLAKQERLHKTWKYLETNLLKEIYK